MMDPPLHPPQRPRSTPRKVLYPNLEIDQILGWADAHFALAGSWPTKADGAIEGADGESWEKVDSCLRQGARALPRGSSLPRLLQTHRGVRNRKGLPRYSVQQILEWADAHRARHGRWPQVSSGGIEDAPGETWSAVEAALQQGTRGLPGGSSLHKLIKEHRKS